MKKQLLILVSVIFLFALSAQAQDASKVTGKRFRIGLGLEAALPLGNLSNVYSVGGGLTLRFQYKATDKFAVTFTTGGIAFIPKNVNNISATSKASINIPFKLGGRFLITEKFYAIMEAGLTNNIVYYKNANNHLAHTSGSSFTYAPGIGVLLGAFDASLRYEGYNSSGFLGLRLGFNF